MRNDEPFDLQMVIHKYGRPKYEDIGRDNGPQASEVAAIISSADYRIFGRRDILLRRRGSSISIGHEVLDTILVMHRLYVSLSYVLSFHLIRMAGLHSWKELHNVLRLHL